MSEYRRASNAEWFERIAQKQRVRIHRTTALALRRQAHRRERRIAATYAEYDVVEQLRCALMEESNRCR